MTDHEKMAACIEGIIDNWYEFDLDAFDKWERSGNFDEWRAVMRERLTEYVWRAMNWEREGSNQHDH